MMGCFKLNPFYGTARTNQKFFGKFSAERERERERWEKVLNN